MPPLRGAGRAARRRATPATRHGGGPPRRRRPVRLPDVRLSAAAAWSQSQALASALVARRRRAGRALRLRHLPDVGAVDDGVVLAACEHSFCRECVLEYARVCVSEARLPVSARRSAARRSSPRRGCRDWRARRAARADAPVRGDEEPCTASARTARRRTPRGARVGPTRSAATRAAAPSASSTAARPGRPRLVYRARRPRRGGGGGGGGRSSTRGSVGDDTEVVRCPNTACGMRISKASGCNHMTCTSCQTHFAALRRSSRRRVRRTTLGLALRMLGPAVRQLRALYPDGGAWLGRCGCTCGRSAPRWRRPPALRRRVRRPAADAPPPTCCSPPRTPPPPPRARAARLPHWLHRVRVGASVGSSRVLRGGLPRLERAGANDECRASRGRASNAYVRVGRRAAAAAPPLLAVISAAAWLFEVMGCGEIRDFLQPASGRAKRRCAARVAANAAARRVPLIVLEDRTRRLPAPPAPRRLAVPRRHQWLHICSCCRSARLRVGCGHQYGQDGQVGDVRTLAQWLRITPFHESVEEGAERLVLLREVVQHNAPILGRRLPAARGLRRRPRDAAAAAALPAARVVPAAHRCLGIDGEWAATLPAAAALCAHMWTRSRRRRRAAARALSVRLIWGSRCLLLPASAVVLVVLPRRAARPLPRPRRQAGLPKCTSKTPRCEWLSSTSAPRFALAPRLVAPGTRITYPPPPRRRRRAAPRPLPSRELRPASLLRPPSLSPFPSPSSPRSSRPFAVRPRRPRPAAAARRLAAHQPAARDPGHRRLS